MEHDPPWRVLEEVRSEMDLKDKKNDKCKRTGFFEGLKEVFMLESSEK